MVRVTPFRGPIAPYEYAAAVAGDNGAAECGGRVAAGLVGVQGNAVGAENNTADGGVAGDPAQNRGRERDARAGGCRRRSRLPDIRLVGHEDVQVGADVAVPG